MDGYNRIPEEYREAYKMLLTSKESIESELEKLKTERAIIVEIAVKDIDGKIESLYNKLSNVVMAIEPLLSKKEEKYPAEATWREKILWVIRTNKRIMTVSEMVDRLEAHEKSMQNAAQIIRINLRRMEEGQEIKKYGNQPRNSKYGLAEWFVNNRIKTAYV